MGSDVAIMAGYRTFAGTPDSWTNYTVGPLGRVLASVQQTHLRGDSASYFYPFSYVHYAGGALASLTYPSQRTLTSCYDGYGRPSWVSAARTQSDCKGGSGSGALYANASAYWPHGAIQSLSYGNGLVESAAYNNRLQPTSIGVGSLWLVGYDYGSSTANNGNLLAQTQTAPGMNVVTAYKYDKANRLAVAVEQPLNAADPVCGVGNLAANGWCHQYGYDRWGNRRIAGRVNDGQGVAEPASFNPANNRIADSNWQYEGRGAVTKDAAGRSYGYDGESRMVATCSPQNAELPCPVAWGAGREVYTYDAEGRRVRRDDKGGGQTVYVYDAAGQLAAEYATQAPPALCTTCYLTVDHLGSTRMLTDASGAVKERLDYQPFGRELLATSGSPRSGIAGYGSLSDSGVPLKFTGKERDAETGLDYFGARYLSSAQGRWTSPDRSPAPMPIPYGDLSDPQTLNLYAYVRNNPLSRRDSDGHCAGDAPNCNDLDPNPAQVGPRAAIAIDNSVKASKRPTADDSKGGSHEEGGVAWTQNGKQTIAPAQPGAAHDVTTKGVAGIDPYKAADPKLQKPDDVQADVDWHVHPAAQVTTTTTPGQTPMGTQITFGGPPTQVNTSQFDQPPSVKDIGVASPAPTINIVVGARNRVLYVYTGQGTACQESLKDFNKQNR